MLTNLCRLAVVCTLCLCATALQHSSYRLVVGDGGYARLLKPAPSLTDLTLAAWVNITQFPYGVAPILTAVSPDASGQVAFFLRHDGLGVLWGGPPSVPRYQLDQVDRHPRTQWTPVDTVPQKRQRRDAVDYSGGLGDIENIMADSRSGRSYDTWSPYGFVDVDTMGVADLEASPSGLNADLHLLSTRDGFARSESYNDWTIVPYELAMQESDPHDVVHFQPEPRIITEPSGDNDFVLFNWNVPAPPKPSIPQSPNEWSPMWEGNKEALGETLVQEENTQEPEERVLWPNIDNTRWSSQVTEVKLGANHWNPYRIRGASFTPQNPQKQQPTTTTPRPRPTTTTARPTTTTARPKTTRIRITPGPTRRVTPTRPTPPKPKTTRPLRLTTSRSGLRWRTSERTTTTTTLTPPTAPQQNRLLFSSSSQSIPEITTTQRPLTRETNVPRSTASSSRQSTRMPLWKLIKQPNPSHSSTDKADIQTTTTPTTTTTSTTTTTTTTTTEWPTTTKAITRKNLPQTLSSRFTTTRPRSSTRPRPTTRPRPASAIRFTPQTEITDKPEITGQKSKVSIWSSTDDIFKQNKEFYHSEKWSDKSQGSANTANKDRPVQITSHHVEEFQRAMEGLPTVKDGNTAVVYSVPITDVDGFNAMYQHYQAQLAPSPPSTTKAPTVIKEFVVKVHEDETNENQLGETNFHLQDTLSYGFPSGPEATYEETAAPALLTEEEAVLIPTEEPLPPTPSRSDIPIAEDALPIQTSEVLEGAFKQSPVVNQPKQENVQDLNKEEQPVVILVVDANDKPQEPKITSAKPYTIEASSTSSPITQSTTEKTVEITSNEHETIIDDVEQILQESVISEIPFYLDSTNRPTTTEEIDLSTESLKLDKPIETIPAFSVVKGKSDTPTTARPQTTPTTELPTTTTITTTTPHKTPSIKTNAHSQQEETVSVGSENAKFESNNFAVFHVSEDDIPYFPKQEATADQVFSFDELYQPEGILVTQEEAQPVSHYQEPANLYHQQLPPEYKSESAPRPIAYSGPLIQAAEPKVDDSDDVLFSADPQRLIEQGFLPQPVHYVSTHEEADQWMQEQYGDQPQIEERVFAVDSDDTINTVAKIPAPSTETTPQASGNFHFRKLPYDFSEDQWYHLAFTWSSRDHQVGVYINGALAGTLTDVLPGHLALSGGGLTILGQTLLPDLTDFDPTSQFIGEMSDINVWGQRLGSEAVQALYQCQAQIPVTPAIDWQQLSMRFYSDVYIQENNALCGA